MLYFLCSIHSTIQTWNEWQDNPTITTINTTAYPIQNIEFPAITICSQGTAKDLMDKVIMIQFEAYLRARGIKPETNATKATNGSTGKRRKRSTEKRISDTLPEEKVCPLINPHCKIIPLVQGCNLVTKFSLFRAINF